MATVQRILALLVLLDPGQGGFHIGKFAGGESLDAHARRFGALLRQLGARDAVNPDEAATDLGCELLLLLFAHTSTPS
jgi:hypothetical protein